MNLTNQLIKIMTPKVYKGCFISQKGNKFYAAGKPFDSVQEAKDFIDRTLANISKTIKQ